MTPSSTGLYEFICLVILQMSCSHFTDVVDVVLRLDVEIEF